MKNKIKSLLTVAAALFFSNLISGQTAPADSIYMMAEKPASFPGGHQKVTQYLMSNIKMPQKCRELQIGGMPVIEFVVEKDGTPSSFKVAESATTRYASDPVKFEAAKLIDEEALRLARNMAKWSPAEQDGQPVRMRMRLPMKFTIY